MSTTIVKNLVVLAGGFGTRLRTAVSDVPKPLAPVMNKPYLEYLIDSWIAQGVTSMIFLLHHHAEMIENFLTDFQNERELHGCKLETLVEEKALGTGGSVANAVSQLDLKESFLVSNADTWLGTGIVQMSVATEPAMAVIHVNNTDRYGNVLMMGNKITTFEEKQNSFGPGLINAGLYHLHSDQFRNWDGLPYSLEQKLFPNLVSTHQLTAVPLETDFIDIGIPDDYFRFCKWIESDKEGIL